MTLTIGIIARDGVVMASDSRLSSTLYSNDTVEKIIELDEHTAVGIAGDGTLATHLFDLIKQKLDLSLGIENVAEQICTELSERFDKYYPKVAPEKRDILDLLLIGYTKEAQPKAHIYSLSSVDNFIPRQSPSGHNSIGIPHIANYLLNRIHVKDVINSQEAAKLSVLCIRETGHQYNSVGGKIKVVTFSDTKKFQIIPNTQMTSLINECKDMQDKHKNRFYPEEEDTTYTN